MKTSLLDAIPHIFLVAGVLLAVNPSDSQAFPRYKNDTGTSGSNCSQCHGDFTGTNSPKSTVFPADSKHEMHRGNSYMNTDCDLCHTTGDDHNPFTNTSNGTASTTGMGCSGCHVGPGLRAHHVANGVNCTAICHMDDPPPAPENSNPPYYGSPDTLADNPCNDSLVGNMNENWSLGDFLGLDNDGDNLYDLADFDCHLYRVLSVDLEGDDVRITWETAGGRTDAIQASAAVDSGYDDVSSFVSIPGVGLVVTNYLEVGGASNNVRFYRVRSVP